MINYSAKMGDGQTIAYKILGILHHIAENREQQEACTKLYHSILPGKEQDKMMSNALSDGLRYGNWPWIKFQVSELIKD